MTAYYLKTPGAGGSDSNNGTSAGTAKATFAGVQALGLVAGDATTVYAGTYAEKVTTLAAGASGNLISWTNNTGDTVTLTGNASDEILRFNHAYVKFNGINLDRNEYVQGDRSYLCRINRVTGCQLYNCNLWCYDDPDSVSALVGGVVIEGTNAVLNTVYNVEKSVAGANTFQDFKFNDAYGAGSTLTSCTGNVHINNGDTTVRLLRMVFTSCNFRGSTKTDGIQCNGVANSGTNIQYGVVRACQLYNNAENGFDGKCAVDWLLESNVFYNNRGDNDGDGALLGTPARTGEGSGAIGKGSNTDMRRIIVRKNIFFDNASGFGMNYRWYNISTYNNAFINNDRDYTGANSTYTANGNAIFRGIDWDASGASVVVNNIFGGHSKAEVAGNLDNASGRFNHNLYWLPSASDTKFANKSTGTAVYLTFPAWQTAMGLYANILGKDANSSVVTATPFSNVAIDKNGTYTSTDWDLSGAGSSAYHTGGLLAVTTAAGTSVLTVPVDNAKPFYDGYGITGEVGDVIVIGATSTLVTAVNYTTNVITLSTATTYSNGASVFYETATPNIGPRGVATADVTAPTVPGTPTFADVTATSMTVNWTASTDAVGVTSYQVRKDGIYIGPPVTTNQFLATNLAANTSYSWTVRANDAAGNSSAYSSAGVQATSSGTDSTPPTFAGATGCSYDEETNTITITWLAGSDAVTAADALVYDIYVTRSTGKYGSTAYTSSTGTLGTSFTAPYAGKNYFKVLCRDAAGNSSTTIVEVSETASRRSSYRAHL